MYVRHLSLDRLPLLGRGRGRRSSPGVDRARRPQRRRARPTWSRRSATWPRWLSTGSPPTRRWSGSGAERGGRPGGGASATTASCWSSWRSTPAGPTGPGSTARRCRGRGTCSACCARCCSRPRTSPWSGATRPSGAASSTSCWSRARPRLRRRARRLRPGAQAAQRPAEDAPGAPGRRGRRPAHPRRLGRPPGRRSAPSCSPPGWAWSPRSRPHVATAYADGGRPGAARPAWLPSTRAARSATAPRRPGAPLPDAAELAAALRERVAERAQRRARPRHHAGRPAPRRPGPRASAAGPAKGYASHGESWSFALALRLAAFDAAAGRRRATRCWCSTTSSPSWTPTAAAGWPSWSRPAEQVLITAAVADDVPAELRGARYDVADGQVRRVR